MGSHSYLQNLQTNINSLQTAGLLHSHANRHTTTNVGHMVGGRTSVIDLSELYAIHFTDAQIAAAEAKADTARDAAEARINANTKLTDIQKKLADDAAEAADAKVHAWLEAYRAAPELSELFAFHFTDAQIAAAEAKADTVRDFTKVRINANTRLNDIQKKHADNAADAAVADIHAFLEARLAAQAAPELSELCLLTHAIGSALAKLCNHAAPTAVEKVQNSGYGYI